MHYTTPPISVIIADDHSYFRKGFTYALTGQKEIEVIAEASNGKELYTLVQKYTPDVVVTDISMPELSGIEVARLLKQHYPKTGIIALSFHEDVSIIKEMLSIGINGYLAKNTEIEDVTAAIRTAHKGKFYVSTTTSQYIGQVLHYSGNYCPLTKREMEIIQLLFQEMTSREIGDQLCLSKRTIEDYRKHIQKKTGAKNIIGIKICPTK